MYRQVFIFCGRRRGWPLLALGTFLLLLAPAFAARSAPSYAIEAISGNTFVIAGAKFTARAPCSGWYAGDLVSFRAGSPDGTCEVAKLFNRRLRAVCVVVCDPQY